MKRRMFKKRVSVLCCLMLAGAICVFGKHADAQESGLRIDVNEFDKRVIPDKYNTGAKGELMPVGLGERIGDVKLKAGNNATTNVLDFAYGNGNVEGTVVFENLDFSSYPFALYNGVKAKNEVHVVFNNCKFSSVSWEKADCLISAEFENCTLNSFYGSQATFEHCSFGGSYTDGIVPFQNVQVNNCFFSDMTDVVATDKERHIDGTQIYGHAGIDVINVAYNNCRFEIPPIPTEGSTAYVNACLMLQMEYSNADGVTFQDCIVNGGGYTVYAWSKKEQYTLQNVVFRNIRFGCANKFGKFYSRISPAVALEDIADTDALYIGSVWKENGMTHLSVTNDTNQARTLLVYTDKGEFEFEIAACPKGAELTSDMSYDQMPFDLDIVIPENCEYAVCFDKTSGRDTVQIRFVNWSGEEVVLGQADVDKLFSVEEEVITSGICGKNVSYRLMSTGAFYLEGTGATYNYHSGSIAPWTEYTSLIEEIYVSEGIDTLGNQLFKANTAATKVSLPSTLKSIGRYTFGGCSCLLEITLPAAVEKIDGRAFPGSIQTIYYSGANWEKILEYAGDVSWIARVDLTGSTESIETEEIPLSSGVEVIGKDSSTEHNKDMHVMLSACIIILLLGGCIFALRVKRQKIGNRM